MLGEERRDTPTKSGTDKHQRAIFTRGLYTSVIHNPQTMDGSLSFEEPEKAPPGAKDGPFVAQRQSEDDQAWVFLRRVGPDVSEAAGLGLCLCAGASLSQYGCKLRVRGPQP